MSHLNLYIGPIYELNKLTDDMGPIYKFKWDIHHLDKPKIKYALYDVLFLREFVFDILRTSKESNYNPKNIEIIPELTRLIYLEKWNISHIIETIKPVVDNMGNYNIKDNTKLNDIYSNFIEHYSNIDVLKLDLKHIIDINIVMYFNGNRIEVSFKLETIL